jgi:quinol monooxygenase YgiN
MTAYNVVRLRVKPGKEDAFLKVFKESTQPAGSRRAAVIKTGERSYCMIGEWNGMDDIVAARTAMIADLDKMRDMLEDLGGGLGVTDPVSGDVVLTMK